MRAILGASLTRTFAELILFGYVPLYLYGAGEHDLLRLALITAAPALVRFGAANLWGAWLDVSGHPKATLLVGLAGYIVAATGLAGLARTGLQAVLVVSVASALFAAVSPAGKTLVSRAAADENPSRGLAMWLQMESWGWMLGSVAVALRQRIGLAAPALLGVTGAVVALEMVWVALTPVPSWRAAGAPAGVWGQLAWGRLRAVAEDWHQLYGRPEMALLFGAFALATLAGEGSFTIFGLYLVQELGGTEALYGTSVAASTGLAVAAYVWLSRRGHHPSPGNVMMGATVGYVALYAAVAAAPTPGIAALVYAVPVYAFMRAGATWAAGQLTAPSARGGGMGGLDGAEALATALGAVVAGGVARAWGMRWAFWVCAALAVILVGLTWQLRRCLQICTGPAKPAVAPGGR